MEDVARMIEFREEGVAGYAELTAFAIMLPVLVATVVQNKRVFRIACAAACLPILAVLMLSTLAGVIFLVGISAIGSVIYFSRRAGLRPRKCFLTVVGFVVLGVAGSLALPFVYGRAEFGRYFDKLVTLLANAPDIIAGRGYDPTARYALMLMSLETFLRNPVIGVGLSISGDFPIGVGGHSTLVDALCLYGVARRRALLPVSLSRDVAVVAGVANGS